MNPLSLCYRKLGRCKHQPSESRLSDLSPIPGLRLTDVALTNDTDSPASKGEEECIHVCLDCGVRHLLANRIRARDDAFVLDDLLLKDMDLIIFSFQFLFEMVFRLDSLGNSVAVNPEVFHFSLEF